jgi:FeS assembly SUF system protein
MFWRKKVENTPAVEEGVATEEATVLEQEPVQEAAPVAEDNPSPPASENIGVAQLEGQVIEAISSVFDPEIPVNIYELGLIYDININGMNDVRIDMTLTSPACPVAGTLPGEVELAVKGVESIGGVHVELVWEPPWTPDRMSEAARLELGFM